MPDRAPGETLDRLSAALAAIGCVDAADEARALLGVTRDASALRALVARRAAGVPLQVLVGYADFCGLRLHVADGVFLPRPRSELLASVAVRRAREGSAEPVLVDLCCGVGGLAAVLAASVPSARVVAADADPAAVACAKVNGAVYGFGVVQGDLCDALPEALRGRVEVMVANLPHVPTAELDHLPRDTRAHEPRLAHDGGADGLAVLRRLAGQAPGWLGPGGVLVVELATRQEAPATALLTGAGYGVAVEREDRLRTCVLAATPG